MKSLPHVCAERVRWADVDLIGIARFSCFTRFVEHAEQEWLRSAGLPYTEIFSSPDVLLPRRHLSIDYLSPARLDEPLGLITWVAHTGDSSLTFRVEIVSLQDSSPRASATVVVVCVGAKDFSKQSLPAELLERIAPFRMDRDSALQLAGPALRELAASTTFRV